MYPSDQAKLFKMWQKQHFARKCLKSRPFEAPTIAIETTRPGESKNQGPGARFTGRFFGGGQPARGGPAAGWRPAGGRPAAGRRPAEGKKLYFRRILKTKKGSNIRHVKSGWLRERCKQQKKCPLGGQCSSKATKAFFLVRETLGTPFSEQRAI